MKRTTPSVQQTKRKRLASLPFLLAMLITVTGCDTVKDIFDPQKHDFIDRKQKLSRKDYENMIAPKGGQDIKLEPHFEGNGAPSAKLGEPPVPKISDILATPRPPAIGNSQLVSIFVTDDVPLKDVLIELSRLANIDIELDPAIEGGIVFRAQNRPFNEVIERIATLANLRYYIKNNVLRIERDTAYVQTYPLDFLSFDRSSTSDVNISTSVLSAGSGGGGGGGGGGLNSGSGAAVTYTAESDFWKQMEGSIKSILSYTPMSGLSQPKLAAAATEATTAASDAGGDKNSFYVINRQGGTLTISGTHRQQELISRYLKELRNNASAQVLIESKIIEVTLDNQFQTGVNWNRVFRSNFATMDADYNKVSSTNGITELLIGGDSRTDPSLDAIVNLTESFGTTRTLSSPRIHAMNNQQAVLTFAQNLVYFQLNVQREEDTSGATNQELLTVDSTAVTVPVGVIISLQPSINPQTNEITLSVRPTLSRIIDYKDDPSVAFLLATVNTDVVIENKVPEIEVRELDSLMRMRSGQVMVLGGLMEQTGANTDNGVPFISSIPWIGNAFKGVDKNEKVKELFILVKATIVGNNTDLHDADKQIYQKFTTDHRPLAF